jgi:hypothetical protein
MIEDGQQVVVMQANNSLKSNGSIIYQNLPVIESLFRLSFFTLCSSLLSRSAFCIKAHASTTNFLFYNRNRPHRDYDSSRSIF